MSTPVIARTALTDAPVLSILADRWSPRAFAPDASIDEDLLASALEAARWAPSAYNKQPWRFIVARRGTDAHVRVLASLVEFNQAWAVNAAVLVVGIAETTDADGEAQSHAVYDLGQSVAHLSVQAHHDGLYVHQMSGFDPEAVRASFDLEARFEPTVVVAIGPLGDTDTLPEQMRGGERAPRVRRPIDESVIGA